MYFTVISYLIIICWDNSKFSLGLLSDMFMLNVNYCKSQLKLESKF